jgi:hypothetical protein
MTPETIYVRNTKSREGLWYKDDVFLCESCGSVQYIRSDVVAKLLNCDPINLIDKMTKAKGLKP